MPDPGQPRARDSPPANKRNSLTNRLLGSFKGVRKDAATSSNRRSSSGLNGSGASGGSSSKQGPVLRIREWLDNCNAEHNYHCSPPSDPSRRPEISTWRPVWLIDSVEKCLVRAKPADRYLALSYVWGPGSPRGATDPPAQLMRTNLDAYQLSLPDSGIPNTVMDTIWLAKKLGIRYLWVDRLCILQDDEQEKAAHVQHMPYVFSNAYLTIVAACGDVYTGLLPLNTRRPPRSPRSANKDHNELLQESKWNTRGWTLQELLYSRRAVFFFEDTFTWECHCELLQGSTTSIMKKLRGGNRQVCTNRVSSAAFGYQHAPWPDMDELARITSDYSARRVTVVDDTLKAFAGITHVLSRIFQGGFVYGMPLMFLDIALLWRPTASIRRRALTKPPFLPSWSWMGWWFDGVPVDLTLWRAAADYVEESKVAKRGQASKRFQSPHSFRIKPTVAWRLTDRSANVPVVNNGLQFRDLRARKSSTASLPVGWRRSGSFFKHDDDEDTLFKYPVPVEDPPEEGDYSPPAGDIAFPGPFLSFRTTGGVFDVDHALTLSPRDKDNPPIAVGSIWSRSHRWVGEFRAHDGWLGIQTSNYDGDEKLEFIAISTATERRGSHVFSMERFEESMDEDEAVDIVNVLWVERIGGVAYRRGVGHVLQKAWEAQAKDEVDVLLG